jgi:hypothetical protein
LAQPGDETSSSKLQQRVQALTTQDVAMLMVSPSPEAWGDFILNGAPPALNLEELIHV